MDGFQQRVANVFAALGQGPPAAPSADAAAQQQQETALPPAAWQLDINQGFKAGRGADESDEEDEGAVPEPLPGAAGSDEDEGDYVRHASASFCRAFEREAEEDEFDTMAVQGMGMRPNGGAAADRPDRFTEVLDDNPFDRLCELRQRPQTDSAGVGGASIGLPGAQEPHRQAKRSHVGVSTPLTAAAGIAAAAAEGGSERADDEEQRHQRAKLPDGRHHPTPNGNGGGPAAEAAAPTRGGRRVTFDLPPSASATGRGGGGHAHGSGSGGGSQGGGGSYGGGGRGWGGRGRGRGRAVPDHVVHPERYTVYTLDEPIYVGQGDKGRGAWGREEAENKEAAASAQRVAAASHASEEGPSEHDPERFVGDFGAGGFKFQPSAKRPRSNKLDAASGAQAAAAAAAARRGAFVEEYEEVGHEPAAEPREHLSAAAGSSGAQQQPHAHGAPGQGRGHLGGQGQQGHADVPAAMEVDEGGGVGEPQEEVAGVGAPAGSGGAAAAAAGAKAGRRRNYRTKPVVNGDD